MEREEFIGVLDREDYSYEIEGDKIIVTHKWDINLQYLTSLPPSVEFRNWVDVWLNALTSLPPGVEFKNEGDVGLSQLKTLPPGAEFRNGGNVYLDSLQAIHPGVEFKNRGSAYLNPLIEGWFNNWNGNMEGIDSKRLLNLMISKEMFI